MTQPGSSIRIAALADLHLGKTAAGQVQPILAQAAASADILVLCGDLTDLGLPEEARVLARELAGIKVPVVAVLGNHDYHSGHASEVRQILQETGAHILDGDAIELEGVGFAGVKGFAGGFDKRLLAPWGEETIKRFVHEAVEETLKLESGLAKLRARWRIAVLHYAPVRATVEGEPPEIFPFLGSSRLEEPINRYGVTAVFHGHAHNGSFEGRTHAGIPVYNVSLPLLRKTFPDGPPFHLLTLSSKPQNPEPG